MRKLVVLVISVAAFGIANVPAMATGAEDNHANYIWVVGAVPPTSSDTAMAPDGSTITMKGQGALMAGPASFANGGGTYTKSDGGGSGTWKATALLSFVSYGSGAAQGLPAAFTGGEAKLHVSLSNGQDGTLTIFCVLGSPPGGKMEGIQLILGSAVSGEYTKQDGGNTVFIKI